MAHHHQSSTGTSITNGGGSSNHNTARPPASYPSPGSSQHYPSPSMSSYAYPPPTPGQGSEPSYRASPTGSNVSLPSLNLPPIRTVDGRQQSQQPQSQYQGGPPTSAPPPLPPPPNAQYYPSHTLPPPQHMNITSDPNQHMRYPLPPPPDGRIMSGGRHKKEIKRRTKTGCLTCRKRRIKCDEAHPSCRNCLKSKRECLGYDPIFKSQPGPTAIQPAPSASPTMQGSPSIAAPYPPPPQGYVTAGSHPYPPASAGAGSPPSSTEPYNDYGAAIDPSLEAAADPSVHSANRTKVDELLALRGVYPPSTANVPKPIPPPVYEEIKGVYSNVYGPALDKFFETRWFQLRGLSHLLNDTLLCEKIATLLARFAIDPSHPQYFAATAGTHSLEASIIWGMMSLCRHVANTPNPTNGQVNYFEINDGVQDAAKRFEIFENLILGQYFDSKPSEEPKAEPTARNGTVFDEQQKTRERDFWRHIHTFLSIRSPSPPSPPSNNTKEIDHILTACRQLLDSKENRDVLYSIVIARYYGARVPEFPSQLSQPPTNEENDEKAKLGVAKNFIEGEAGGKGTNQVIQRVCGMAIRSWSMPR